MLADIVVAGGGFTGALAAAALARRGRRIVVVDARPAGRPPFGGELVHARGVDILSALGLESTAVRSEDRRIHGFSVTASGGEAAVCLPYGGVPDERPGGLAICHHDLVARLRQHLAGTAGVEVRTGRVVDVLRKDGRTVGVRTADGESISAKVTLIADGRHSRLRQACGIRARQRALSLSAILLAPETALPVRHFAHIALGGPGPILAYPLGGNSVRFCVDVAIGAERNRCGVAELLRKHYAPVLPEPFRTALLTALDLSFDLVGNHTVHTDQCTVPGGVLLGDAAGCSHPLTASGMTNSLNDVCIFAEELNAVTDLAASHSVDAALTRYAARRYRFIRVREILAEELYQAFRGGDAAAMALRHGIFRYWRTSASGRAATVALLSGDDARPSAFLAEYLGVMRQSVQAVMMGQVCGRSMRTRAHSLANLVRESVELLNRVGVGVYTGTGR